LNTLKLTIGGMHCGGCAKRLTLLLEKESGVKNVAISSDEGTGSIAFGPHSTSEDKIINVVEQAGFTAERA